MNTQRASKTCTKCGETKPLTEYYAENTQPQGQRAECKDCNRDKCRRYRDRQREVNGDAVRARERQAWHRRPKDKRIRARRMVKHAIHTGRLKRPTICTRCGKKGKINAHHFDYDAPLQIVWLCTKCHGIMHRSTLPSSPRLRR